MFLGSGVGGFWGRRSGVLGTKNFSLRSNPIGLTKLKFAITSESTETTAEIKALTPKSKCASPTSGAVIPAETLSLNKNKSQSEINWEGGSTTRPDSN